MTLSDLLETIGDPPPEAGQLRGVEVPKHEDMLLGVNDTGGICLIGRGADHSDTPTTVRLKYVRARWGVSVRLDLGDREVEDQVDVIEFTGDSQGRREFLVLVEALLGGRDEGDSLRTTFQTILRLLRYRSRAAQTSLVGLWGELLVIASSAAPQELIDIWHTRPSDRIDFGNQAEGLEVKTTRGRRRLHLFSLDQLSGSESLWIVSLIADAAGGGDSVWDLVADIGARIPANAYTRVVETVVASLGEEASNAADIGYDRQRAVQSMKIYSGTTIPTPVVDDDRISGVRFRADLSGLEPETLSNRDGLLGIL